MFMILELTAQHFIMFRFDGMPKMRKNFIMFRYDGMRKHVIINLIFWGVNKLHFYWVLVLYVTSWLVGAGQFGTLDLDLVDLLARMRCFKIFLSHSCTLAWAILITFHELKMTCTAI